jgi:hypothetical protein
MQHRMDHMYRTLIVVCATVLGSALAAQDPFPRHVLKARVVDGDTIATIELPEANVEGRWKARDRREAARYDKLTRNIIKVYPYASAM